MASSGGAVASSMRTTKRRKTKSRRTDAVVRSMTPSQTSSRSRYEMTGDASDSLNTTCVAATSDNILSIPTIGSMATGF